MTLPRFARRTQDLIVRRSDGELLIYDKRADRVHLLPPELAKTWETLEPGTTEAQAGPGLAQLIDLDLVEVAGVFDRRRLLARGGLIGAGALGATILAPLAHAAATYVNPYGAMDVVGGRSYLVSCVGGNGGGGYSNPGTLTIGQTYGSPGGRGASISALLSVLGDATSTFTLNFASGQGGGGATSGTAGGAAGQGYSYFGGAGGNGSGGGGALSSIYYAGGYLFIAGGGGGGGYTNGATASNPGGDATSTTGGTATGYGSGASGNAFIGAGGGGGDPAGAAGGTPGAAGTAGGSFVGTNAHFTISGVTYGLNGTAAAAGANGAAGTVTVVPV